jgi:hypothetical protein
MGLKDRIFSRPAGAEPDAAPAPDAVPDAPARADTMVLPPGALGDVAPAGEATQQLPVVAVPPVEAEPAAEPAPAIDPVAAVPANPTWRERGRLRRRLRYLREVRELGYRDLGGLVFDQHRFQRPNDGLVQGKVLAIDAVDRELRAIEQALRAGTLVTELALPGVSACQRCGALHGSDARYCPQCGLAFAGPRTVAGMGDASTPVPAPMAGPGQAALFDPTAAAAAQAAGSQAAPPEPGAPAAP